ncbi:oligosaccharide flippase family protein [Duganella sp. sic0402]|uniref:oligosaccharide flippase family protein n=1 Tax=Duganella sp. sic0402 TaxID=2854786 RepID=UPI001C47531D|nr:oligosaccharide flippase family protein [Duganella sp. sic0402]MBV7535972.1 oligosaccharide flippase family protein [Duganella sp. sic0402]
MKNVVFMGASTLVRLVFGLLTFTMLARLLGPNEFGLFMFWLSISTLLGMLANYGFTGYVLREIGARPEGAHAVMGEVLSAKVLLSVLILAGTLVSMLWIDAAGRWVFLALMLAILADSITDFLNVGYRATNRFSAETRIATVAAALQFGIVVASVWPGRGVLAAAIGFMLSRLAVTAMTWSSQLKYFAGLRPASLAQAAKRLREAMAYAVDFALQSLFGQIDSVVLNYFVDPVAVGLHQAGMRLVLGGAQAANVLANVFIPRLSAVHGDHQQRQKEGQRLQLAFLVMGIGFGLFLTVLAEPITHLLFGAAFSSLAALLPWFGLLFFVRFLASSFGIMLTSAGLQGLRAKANVFHWLLILGVAWKAVPMYGNTGWLLALILGNLALALVYFGASVRLVRPTVVNGGLTLAGAAAFLPFLHLA